VRITYEWRGDVSSRELNELHAEAFETRVFEVARAARHRGIGTELVGVAAREARAAGCEWLHVDFDAHLRPFYFEACGFRPTNASLIEL
jgi:GNAT superfamily N-acetyltransferase